MSEELKPSPVIERGCGRRKAGGLYLCTNSSGSGVPIDSFLLCPTRPLTAQFRAAISPLGVHVIEQDGYAALVDWVGSEHYPTFPHFWCEGREFGLSRKISDNPALLARLTPRSLVVYVHAQGHLANAAAFHRQRAVARCAKGLPAHIAPAAALEETCVSLLWETHGPAQGPSRERRVVLPSGSAFRAWTCPPAVAPAWEPALCAAIPLSFFHLEVVQSRDGSHKETVEKAHTTTLPVLEVMA